MPTCRLAFRLVLRPALWPQCCSCKLGSLLELALYRLPRSLASEGGLAGDPQVPDPDSHREQPTPADPINHGHQCSERKNMECWGRFLLGRPWIGGGQPKNGWRRKMSSFELIWILGQSSTASWKIISEGGGSVGEHEKFVICCWLIGGCIC